MANYDNKLGEWFRQLDRREEELKTKKKTGDAQPVAEPVARQVEQVAPAVPAAPVQQTPVVESVVVEEPVAAAPASSVAVAVESCTVVADTKTVDEPAPIPAIFDETEASPVEDFFSFLSRSEAPAKADEDTFPVAEISRNRGIGHLSEGTGDPRPVVPIDRLETPPVAGIDKIVEVEPEPVIAPKPEPVRQEVIAPAPKPKRVSRKVESSASLQEKWDRMPHHLQTLFGVSAGEEVAQNSYKTFKENRGELIQRLLDPPITLEEAARVLNVCPTTVRRYTNRGILKHFRTAGNQRRFRLSDVLTFMETKGRSAETADED